MAHQFFYKGARIRVSGEWKDSQGNFIDPTTVKFKFTPAGASSATTYTYPTDVALVRSAAGQYYVDLDIDTSGVWRWRWESTGVGKAAFEDEFTSRRSYF